MNDDPSHFGFDDDRTVSAKLGRMFLLVLMGIFLMMFTTLVFGLPIPFWWKLLAEIALEIGWTFWLLAMIVNWWRPRPLHRFFRHAEKRMVWLFEALRFLLSCLFVICCLAWLVIWLWRALA